MTNRKKENGGAPEEPVRAANERNWIEGMAALEEESGEVPAILARSTSKLSRIPTVFHDWKDLEAAIRPEVPKGFILQLKKEIGANLLSSALSTIWRAVTNDLRRKIATIGVQHFSALEGMPALKTVEELETEVTPYRLLQGARQLGLLNEEGYVHLNHCRELVAGYLETERFQSEVDRLDLLNAIKNCIKFSLSAPSPAPGFDIKRLLGDLETHEMTDRLVAFDVALAPPQPTRNAATIARLLFKKFTEPATNPVAESNILQLFPVAWKHADEETRRGLGDEFVSLRLTGSNDQAGRAWSLLLSVGGTRYLPEAMMAKYFEQASTALLEAHHKFGNFHLETEPARVLRGLGTAVPVSARDAYVKAVAICFLGNKWGHSFEAEPYLRQMIADWDSQLVTHFMRLLGTDLDIRSTLMSVAPASRLRLMLTIIQSNLAKPQDRELASRYLAMEDDEIVRSFINGPTPQSR